MCKRLLQGHALFTRQAGGDLPCPALDFTGGFNQFMAAAYNLTGMTIKEKYGVDFGEATLPDHIIADAHGCHKLSCLSFIKPCHARSALAGMYGACS